MVTCEKQYSIVILLLIVIAYRRGAEVLGAMLDVLDAVAQQRHEGVDEGAERAGAEMEAHRVCEGRRDVLIDRFVVSLPLVREIPRSKE